MSNPIYSSKGNFKATIGKRKDGTYSVSTYMVGFAEYPDLQTFVQDGFSTRDDAERWAVSDLEQSELEATE